ncbi:MAG: gamma-glutamyl-gamma-aminobutyrate hydrolase family protein [Candidatus Sumerlaeia bacterium]|nr:gamma-glutamyl-gamma-aminobutyrate hydrolase family protein [Candidatus Sumerlaeia bacterium]
MALGERPVIGINVVVSSREGSDYVSMSVGAAYVDAVVAAGGLPVLVPSVLSDEHLARYIEMVDGFVLTGGADISPARYGQDPHPTVSLLHPRREEFDFKFLESALATGKPVLGICLGMQQLNVLKGGSMIQDIPSQTTSTINHRPSQPIGQHAHDVEVVPGTRLHALLGTTSLRVNSLHHQACIVSPESNVVVSAVAPDGIVEAIELPDHPFALGVQWHPESLASEDPHLNLFRALVEQAAETKRRRAEAATPNGTAMVGNAAAATAE